jgi:hypothetical protein
MDAPSDDRKDRDDPPDGADRDDPPDGAGDTGAGWRSALPGIVATVLMSAVVWLWVFWSLGEMFYEGWGPPFPHPLLYLIPGAATLGLTLAALRWPRFGGTFLVLVGAWFGIWWIGNSLRAGVAVGDLAVRFLLSGGIALFGLLFLLEARHRRRRTEAGWTPPESWWRRNVRYLFLLVPAGLILLGYLVYWVPILATRVDDGDRGARLVEGNGVTLVWAPEGPGWNWRQDFGGFPSWDAIAWYGREPVGMKNGRERDSLRAAGRLPDDATLADMRSTGLCRHLSADGLRLESEPPGIWRMPTARELVRSLALHGENAGCALDPGFPDVEYTRAACDVTPDKETPLWAPDLEPIYYWVADEHGEKEAFYVNYQGAIRAQPKRWGNPRHGYRCVRDP